MDAIALERPAPPPPLALIVLEQDGAIAAELHGSRASAHHLDEPPGQHGLRLRLLHLGHPRDIGPQEALELSP
jgi:hypothetical protein